MQHNLVLFVALFTTSHKVAVQKSLHGIMITAQTMVKLL